MTTTVFGGFTICRDGHHCDNGSLCTENPYDEGAFYCDCQESFLNDAVAGLSCEHEATEYCTFDNEVSLTTFCTNRGTCRVKVSPEATHMGCNCPTNYEGDHCQFVKGTKPANWPTVNGSPSFESNESNGKAEAGVTAVIVLIVLGFAGVLGYFIYIKRKAASSNSGGGGVVSSPELDLDPDGEVLQHAISHSTVNGSGKLGDAEYELEADGAVLKESVVQTNGTHSTSPSTTATVLEDINVNTPMNGVNGHDDEDKDIV